MLKSAMDAIIIIDQNRRITLFNLAAEKVFQCPAAEATDQPFDRFLTGQFRHLLAGYMQEKNGSHEAARSLWAPEGLTACRLDGEEFPIEATISQVEVSGQKLCTIILRDINARKQAEAELRKLQLENVYLQEEIKTQCNFGEIVGASAAIKKEDIPLLVGYFATRYGSKLGKKIATVPQKTMHSLQAYPWPGNVRELENVIERAVIISPGSQLALGDWIPRPHLSSNGKPIVTIKELERHHILEMLELTGWRVSGEKGAAKILGVKPTTLEARMKKLGIKRKGLHSEAVGGS